MSDEKKPRPYVQIFGAPVEVDNAAPRGHAAALRHFLDRRRRWTRGLAAMIVNTKEDTMPAETGDWETESEHLSWDYADMRREQLKDQAPNYDARIVFKGGRHVVEWRKARYA